MELEPKFHALALDNFLLHQRKWHLMHLPQPAIIQGDSRQFHCLVASPLVAAVTSPPYKHGLGNGGGNPDAPLYAEKSLSSQVTDQYGDSQGQIGAMKGGSVEAVLTSPPYGGNERSDRTSEDRDERRGFRQGKGGFRTSETYGTEAGQIGSMPDGSLDAALTSPPYADSLRGVEHNGISAEMMKKSNTGAQSQALNREGYGETPGQIGALGAGRVDAAITSPPYHTREDGGPIAQTGETTTSKLGRSLMAQSEHSAGQISQSAHGTVDGVITSPPWEDNAQGHIGAKKWKDPDAAAEAMASNGKGNSASAEARRRQFERDSEKTYGTSEGQIGTTTRETYWQACSQVYASVFRALKPGGVIVLVLKDYVRDGKRVPLADDTLRLLTHLGYEPVERIRAMLVSEKREAGLFGDVVQITQRKSFFRRLHERKPGAVKIDWEDVLVCRRPL